eukprot:2301845-Rhodomonas_salina.1
MALGHPTGQGQHPRPDHGMPDAILLHSVPYLPIIYCYAHRRDVVLAIGDGANDVSMIQVPYSHSICCYGTGISYAATRCPVLTARMVLPGGAYRDRNPGEGGAAGSTGLGYALLPYERPMQCPVLT